MSKEFLRKLPLFSGLGEEDLDLLYSMATPLTLEPGELLLEEGKPGDALYVVLEGEFEITRRSGKEDLLLSVRGPGEVLGEMSLLDQAPRNASARALRESKVLAISQFAFQHVLACSPDAVFAVLKTVMSRLRSNEALLAQHGKMAALGTLAAGLAHELNNPAAAVQRSADQLHDLIDKWQHIGIELDKLAFDTSQTQALANFQAEVETHGATPVVLDPLTRGDRETEVESWLESRHVEEAWDHAPVLVNYGWDTDSLSRMIERFTEEQAAVILPWAAAGSSVFGLVEEVKQGAERISEIVKAVKTYSYLDQAPVQQVDIHAGIENTLVILRHKLKSGIEIRREFAPDLPRIEAHGSELNQVWTNIIDNAIDAMSGQGEITIRTYAQLDEVIVEITDNGPGIPADIQPRIFDPFFTSKPVGVGTGLGLHIAYNIVNDKHHGTIEVESRPGRTTFRVKLPIKLARS